MKDITKEHYEDENLVEKYVEVWFGYQGYKYDYSKFIGLLLKNALILDAGCGPGRDVKFFLENKLRVIGIDYAKAMIEKAKEVVPNGEFHVMDLMKLEFESNYFDGVWTTGVLVHFAENELKIVLREFGRVLKPNGIIYICTRIGKGSKVEMGLEGGSFIINYFEKENIINFLKENNFEIISSEITEDDRGRGFDWISIFAKVIK
jgi:ubiquinone/menaquinone biosynthesis C-methylase UbiE